MFRSKLYFPALSLLVAVGTAYAEGDSMEMGATVYKASCASCHDAGTNGAPTVSDMSEWTDRTPLLWSDVQLQHQQLGFLASAEKDAKSGITPEQMEAANNYMVSMAATKKK
ncbi:MAG: c-type cytochrome [Halioglobus sp.]